MKITVKKDDRFNGAYAAKCGKRRVLICVTHAQHALGVIPSANDFRLAFNEQAMPGDKLIDESIAVEFKL